MRNKKIFLLIIMIGVLILLGKSDIYASTDNNGTFAVQYDRSGNYCQEWCLLSTSNGYYKLINRNSNKLLEVQSNLTSNGATVGQWDDTGYSCQEWKLKREGMK